MRESLVFTPSARYDHYSTFGDLDHLACWAADWQIWKRAARPRRLQYRLPCPQHHFNTFGGRGITYIGLSGDPCDSRAVGFNGNANAGLGSRAAGSACSNSLSAIGPDTEGPDRQPGQSPENNLTNDQRGFVIGGYPGLTPEKSHSWTVGAVVTPDFVPGMALNLDYYQITITNSILDQGIPLNLPNTDQYITDCFVKQVLSNCANISRNAGGIFQVSSLNTNTGSQDGSGVGHGS